MIDVMFFLLATFMLASLSLQNLNSLAVNLPHGQAPVLQAAKSVTLTITRDGENVTRELPALDPLDLITQTCKEIRHRVSSKIPIEMVEFNHHLRAKPGDRFLGSHKNFVLSSFNIHLHDVRPNARFFTKGIHRSCMHSKVLSAPVEIDRAASGVRLFVRNCDGNFSGPREDSFIQCTNMPQIVQTDIFLQQGVVSRQRLEGENLASGTDALGKEKRVVADMRADVDDGHPRLNRGDHRTGRCRLPGAIHKTAKAGPVDAHAVPSERPLTLEDLRFNGRHTIK